jgi:S-adenosylmethionine hydrolase
VARPLIALLTDFGLRDHYVGSMKGVMLGICPDAALVDVTHDVPPHDVRTGAIVLAAAYRDFPAGSIFVAVVDPGVGTTRRGIAGEAAGYRFVAPDNGLLSAVFAESTPTRLVELTNRRFARTEVSRTFEGRDRFGPAAAWLATGIDLGDLGTAVGANELVRLPLATAEVEAAGVCGEVVIVDRFGNLVTNIDRRTLDRAGVREGATVRVDDRRARLVSTYADSRSGELCALLGSTGRLEIALNGGSAASATGLGPGARVLLSRACD